MRSHGIANCLKDWLEVVLPYCQAWVSSRDIDSGARWAVDVANKLNESDLGIICLTKDNMHSPWILFEAGALSNRIDNPRVCTFLIDLDISDVKEPLAQFYHTKATETGIKKLIESINAYSKTNSLNARDLDRNYCQSFPTFWMNLTRILSETSQDIISSKLPPECEKSILSEIQKYVLSSIYIEEHLRDEVVTIDINDNTYISQIYQSVTFINPNKEEFNYAYKRYVEKENDEDSQELLHRKFRDLKIRINGVDILEYLKEYRKNQPENGNHNITPNDIYSLFVVTDSIENKRHGGLETNISITIPIAKDIQKCKVEIEHTAINRLNLFDVSFTFRTEYPCRQLKHNISVEPTNKWKLVVIPIEMLYTPHGPKQRSVFTSLVNQGSASVIMDYWTLPGTGYYRSIEYRGIIDYVVS